MDYIETQRGTYKLLGFPPRDKGLSPEFSSGACKSRSGSYITSLQFDYSIESILNKKGTLPPESPVTNTLGICAPPSRQASIASFCSTNSPP